jgi:hypothetical protein
VATGFQPLEEAIEDSKGPVLGSWADSNRRLTLSRERENALVWLLAPQRLPENSDVTDTFPITQLWLPTAAKITMESCFGLRSLLAESLQILAAARAAKCHNLESLVLADVAAIARLIEAVSGASQAGGRPDKKIGVRPFGPSTNVDIACVKRVIPYAASPGNARRFSRSRFGTRPRRAARGFFVPSIFRRNPSPKFWCRTSSTCGRPSGRVLAVVAESTVCTLSRRHQFILFQTDHKPCEKTGLTASLGAERNGV